MIENPLSNKQSQLRLAKDSARNNRDRERPALQTTRNRSSQSLFPSRSRRKQFSRCSKNRIEHLFAQATGERVLLARMVAGEQGASAGK